MRMPIRYETHKQEPENPKLLVLSEGADLLARDAYPNASRLGRVAGYSHTTVRTNLKRRLSDGNFT